MIAKVIKVIKVIKITLQFVMISICYAMPFWHIPLKSVIISGVYNDYTFYLTK